MKPRALFRLACAAGLLASGSFAQSAPTSTYRIGPKDLIAIRVFEVPELNVERRVSEKGTVNLPVIGEVEIEGLTDEEFAASLKSMLESSLLNRASVSVEVREYRSRPITVIGAVKQPGNLPFSGRWTLLEAIAAAGGLSDAHGEYIYVLRRADNGLSDQVSVKIADLMVTGEASANLPIFSSDLINVPAVSEITIFCLGEVASPGEVHFKSTDRISILSAIARAGGLTERASKKILVKRRTGERLQGEIEVDYKRILAGKEPDLTLTEGDVLVVQESFF